jgi:hypothetical protein
MRALKFIVLALALSILIPQVASAEDLGAMRTTLIERGVYIYTQDEGQWFDARANFPLREGDALWAASDGRAEINIRGGTYVRMDHETMLEVLQVGRFLESEDNMVRLFMEEGSLYVNNERSGYDFIQIESGFSSVRMPEGAVAIIQADRDGTSRVSVLKGYVYSQSTGGGIRLRAGSSAVIGEDLYASISPLGEPTAWERWNRDRDKELSGVYASTRYLPSELHDYAYDFDEYGSWVYVREYGHVWRPSLSISVSLGWAPYRHGRWRWRHGHYVWISYERWGWAPYHYGRWAHVGGIGWCWVPPARGAVYWGPGYVAWVYTSGYVGWVPLAPYETYYGYGYYGPYSVNIIDIDIHKTVIKNVYVNAGVKDATTVVARDSFLRGRDKTVRPPKGMFAKGREGVGPPPDFRPDREGKPVKRDLDIYREAAPGKATRRPAAEPGVSAATRPEPPGHVKPEKMGPEPGARPERQGPQMPFETPTRGKKAEPERESGRPEVIGPSGEKQRERVITPPRPSQPERGREREVTPPTERERVITPSRETAPGRTEMPSPPGRMEAPSRPTAPSRETAPGRMEAPSRPTAPSRETAPGRMEAPSRPTAPSRETAPGRMEAPSRTTTPSRESTPSRMEAPGLSTTPMRRSTPSRMETPSKTKAPSGQTGPPAPPSPPATGGKSTTAPSKSGVKAPAPKAEPEETPGTEGEETMNPSYDKGRGRDKK